ncbi:TPA: hypothetical protein NKA74_004635 [Vibrio parahaemolyticus]|nr:hypothetical protein [Vibrio parahaemolyticus]
MISFVKKIGLKLIGLVMFVATILPLYQEFFKEADPQVKNVTTIIKETADNLEIREATFDITLKNTRKYIFVVPGSLSVLRVIASNKSEMELKSCVIIYQYKYDDFNNGCFYYREKAIPARSYKTLTDHEKFEVMTGFLSRKSDDFYKFDMQANSDVEITAVTERFTAPPDALRFYVQCDKRISNKLTINQDEVSVVDRSWGVPNWYYELSKFFVAPYL